jgi:O-acetyl-ADP-ribose deacetylase (regulator of RNase III)
MKPRVFIGSSAEHLHLAYAIQECLTQDAEVTVWTQGVFDLSKSSLESLLETLDGVDYGIFVFAPDDVVKLRGKECNIPRDNVVLELGLFIGRLGRESCFIVAPEDSTLHLPTDLLGTAPAFYDATRAKREPHPAVGPACNKIRRAIARPSAGNVIRISDGWRLLLSPGHSIELRTLKIQDSSPDSKYGAIVLPANTCFDDECIHDTNSALGAYFQTHFSDNISEIQSLLQEQLTTKNRVTKDGYAECYPPGTVVYLERPLNSERQMMIVAVTEKTVGAGMEADTFSLIAAVKGMMRCAVEHRITELWAPVMGTGHGGLDFSCALSMIVIQISNGVLHEGFHSVRKCVITIFDPDGRRAEAVESVTQAFPLLVRG